MSKAKILTVDDIKPGMFFKLFGLLDSETPFNRTGEFLSDVSKNASGENVVTVWMVHESVSIGNEVTLYSLGMEPDFLGELAPCVTVSAKDWFEPEEPQSHVLARAPEPMSPCISKSALTRDWEIILPGFTYEEVRLYALHHRGELRSQEMFYIAEGSSNTTLAQMKAKLERLEGYVIKAR